MTLLVWLLIGAGVLLVLFAGLAAWAFAVAAKLGDEIEEMRRLAELRQRWRRSPFPYRPVSDQHTRDFTQGESE